MRTYEISKIIAARAGRDGAFRALSILGLYILISLLTDRGLTSPFIVAIIFFIVTAVLGWFLVPSPLVTPIQIDQVQPNGTFIQSVNSEDKTPYSTLDGGAYSDITWSTFAGRGTESDPGFILSQLFFYVALTGANNDGLVNVDSIKLYEPDCTNFGPYDGRNHNRMKEIDGALYDDRVYFRDIYDVLTENTLPNVVTDDLPRDSSSMAVRPIPTSVPENSPFELTILAANGRYSSQSNDVEIQLRANRHCLTVVVDGVEIIPEADGDIGYWTVVDFSLAAGQGVEKTVDLTYQLPPSFISASWYLWVQFYRDGVLIQTKRYTIQTP